MRMFLVSVALLGCCSLARPAATIAAPRLVVSAQHLGGGLLQYTLDVDNDLGNNVVAQISVSGNIHQIESDIVGDVDVRSFADIADEFDPVYQAAGGIEADSWWNDLVYSIPSPVFIGPQGGAVGSMLFQNSAATFTLPPEPNVSFLGQIVIVDPAAAAFPIGSATVSSSGLAPFSIVDPGPNIQFDSFIGADAMRFSIVGDFAVVPEPAGLSLLWIGLALLLVRPRRL